jgi:hypothetical protein
VIASIEEQATIERILKHLGGDGESVDPAHPRQAKRRRRPRQAKRRRRPSRAPPQRYWPKTDLFAERLKVGFSPEKGVDSHALSRRASPSRPHQQFG